MQDMKKDVNDGDNTHDKKRDKGLIMDREAAADEHNANDGET